MRYTLVLAALATLAACSNLAPATGEPDPVGAMLVGGMMNRPAAYPPPQPMPIYMPQTVTYQRTGPGTVMAY